MGYELPAAIGAHYATGKRIICLAGDGSIMMNLQELAIIGQQDLPISIYLLNNSGYHSIRQTQQNYFSDNLLGCGIDSGLPFPSFESVARGFELAYRKSSRSQDLQQDLMLSLAIQRPLLHELVIDLDQQFSPKTASRRLDDGTMVSSRLEDMAPFLPHQEIENLRKQALAI
jgi:acetolactate synthase-1/2/3 large subunit